MQGEMDAKETSAINFLAEAVARSPSSIKELLARAIAAFSPSKENYPNFNTVIVAARNINASSVYDIVDQLKDNNNIGVQYFIEALLFANTRNNSIYKRNLIGLENFKALSLNERLKRLKDIGIIDGSGNLTPKYGGKKD